MLVEKTCPICGVKFTVPHWRLEKAKYCSPACRQESLKAKDNVNCSWCGKPFHMKRYQMDSSRRTMGYFCCRECANLSRSAFMSGEGNHQYGLKGALNASFKGEEIPNTNNSVVDILVYVPAHPRADRCGRVTKHRWVVEQNAELFNAEYFDVIEGFTVLKEGYVVHHKDGNHNNNDVRNLEILTRGEHTSIHNILNPMDRDEKSGRFIKR